MLKTILPKVETFSFYRNGCHIFLPILHLPFPFSYPLSPFHLHSCLFLQLFVQWTKHIWSNLQLCFLLKNVWKINHYWKCLASDQQSLSERSLFCLCGHFLFPLFSCDYNLTSSELVKFIIIHLNNTWSPAELRRFNFALNKNVLGFISSSWFR